MAVLGILSDTHIPDRARNLPPRVLDIFHSTGVEAILHAGDICTLSVLQELGQVAPVHAVCGNRDIYTLRHLPAQIILPFAGFKVGMVHGHGRLSDYLSDKAHFLAFGVQEERYKKRVIKALPGVDVMVFGHLHRRIYEWVQGVLLLNPGSACCPDGHSGNPPSVVVLRLVPGSRPDVEFIDLRD
jgi:putative phosphoesterase